MKHSSHSSHSLLGICNLGYMNEGGKLNLKRFEVFMDAMSEVDRDLFRTRYEDLKYMDSKCVRPDLT